MSLAINTSGIVMLFLDISVCVPVSKVSIWKRYLSVALLLVW